MKTRVLAIFAFVCLFVASCGKSMTCEEFITDMYDNSRYQDTEFLETHCAPSVLEKAQGSGVFDTGYELALSDESKILSVMEEPEGWYFYEAYDRGIYFCRRIKLSKNGKSYLIEDIEVPVKDE